MIKIKNVIKSILLLPGRGLLWKAGVTTGRQVRVYGRIMVDRYPGSRIQLADGVILNSANHKNTLEARGPVVMKTLKRNSQLTIGRDTGLTSATVSAAVNVAIGERVLIGAGTLITDSDHHVVEPVSGTPRRYAGFPATRNSDAVVIEDDVFIGARTIVLKGSRIGRGSVIGAGSVVAGVIPPMVVAAGNPCRVVKSLDN